MRFTMSPAASPRGTTVPDSHEDQTVAGRDVMPHTIMPIYEGLRNARLPFSLGSMRPPREA